MPRPPRKAPPLAHRRRPLPDRTRLVVYLNPDERDEIERAARARGITISQFLAEQALARARELNQAPPPSKRR